MLVCVHSAAFCAHPNAATATATHAINIPFEYTWKTSDLCAERWGLYLELEEQTYQKAAQLAADARQAQGFFAAGMAAVSAAFAALSQQCAGGGPVANGQVGYCMLKFWHEALGVCACLCAVACGIGLQASDSARAGL